MNGESTSGFTRERESIATRIDMVYTRMGRDLEWLLSIRVNATLNQISCPSDTVRRCHSATRDPSPEDKKGRNKYANMNTIVGKLCEKPSNN